MNLHGPEKGATKPFVVVYWANNQAERRERI